MNRSLLFAGVLGLLSFSMLGVSGCDSTFIDPFDNQGKYYTVFGFLDETANFTSSAHKLRLIALSRFPQEINTPADDQAFIDARVYTINKATDQIVEWRHSLEQLENGQWGHIYRANFFVQKNHTYRLEIHRSDGIIAYAETRVPFLGSTIPQRGNGYVDAASGDVMQEILLPDIPSPWDIEMVYYLGFNPNAPAAATVRVPYERSGASSPEGWRITANITQDVGQQIATNDMLVLAMGIQARVLDNQWVPPEDEFDPEILANPGVLSNVVNGYGFFGSIGLLIHDWPVGGEVNDLLTE